MSKDASGFVRDDLPCHFVQEPALAALVPPEMVLALHLRE